MPARDGPIAITGEDHLALLGDLEASGHRSRRLRADSSVGGAAAPSESATSPMKQGEPDVVPPRPARERRLGVVQRQGRRERADLLGGIRVAEHHLQPPAVLGEAAPDRRELEHLVHHPRRTGEVVERLEEGDHVERRGTPRASRQLVYGRDVFRSSGEAHDVAPAASLTVSSLQVRDHRHRLKHLFGGGRPGKRFGVHLAVLADLELGQVKPEGLRLPHQALHLAERDARSSSLFQRATQDAEVTQQLGRL